jgi:uncharacterized membrane protein
MKKINLGKDTSSRNFAFYFATILFSVLFLIIGNKIATDNMPASENTSQELQKAVIEELTAHNAEQIDYGNGELYTNTEIIFRAKILSKDNKDQIVTAYQYLDDSLPLNAAAKEVQQGDKVVLINAAEDGQDWQFLEFVRHDKLFIFGGVFVLALLIFGRKKGFNTLLSLAFTCLGIFAVFIPAILSGKNIYAVSIIICLYTIIMTILLVNGKNAKSLAAIIGCFAGVIISGLLTVLMNHVLSLTGVIDEDSIFLLQLSATNAIDLRAIIFGAIVIGAMGAIMDVAMSISSSLWEVREHSNSPTFDGLFKSGMNIGRDVMGTMTNTLILAYIGSSLSIVLLYVAYNSSLLYLFNRELIVVEVLQALVGSLGILLTMPITCLICALFYTKSAKRY